MGAGQFGEIAGENFLSSQPSTHRLMKIKLGAIRSFYFFCKVVLGYGLLNEDNHKRICNPLQSRLKVTPIRHYSALHLHPRETFKSTVMSVGLPMWLLVKNPNLSILLGNKAYGNACKFLGEIKGHYEDNILFRKLFSDWVGPVWSGSEIVVSKRNRVGIKEASIAAIGIGMSMASVHYDIGIFDDIVNEKDRDSAAEREKSINFFKDAVDLVKRDGIKIVAGTRWHPQDAYGYIENELNPQLRKADLPQYDIHITRARDPEGKPNWKVLPDKVLKQKEIEKGAVVYAANYMNNPLPSEATIFAEEKMTFFEMSDLDWRKLPIHGFNDPGLGDAKTNCFSPILTAAIDYESEESQELKKPILYIIDADVKRRALSKMYDVVLSKHEVYHYAKFGVEVVAAQKEIANNLREKAYTRFRELLHQAKEKAERQGQKIDEGKFFDYEMLRVVNHLPKGSKGSRIESIEGDITEGAIRFRKDWQTAPNNYRELIEQLFYYPIHPFRDAPDALEALWKISVRTSGVLV